MVHVLDTSALLSLQRHAASNAIDESDILEGLSDLIQDGDVTFPREVADEVRRRGKGQPVATWMSAVHSARVLKGVDWQHSQYVSHVCKGILDPDQMDESPVYVAAYGRHFERNQQPFHIVTNDFLVKPTRISLAEACTTLGYHHEPLSAFLTCVGL